MCDNSVLKAIDVADALIKRSVRNHIRVNEEFSGALEKALEIASYKKTHLYGDIVFFGREQGVEWVVGLTTSTIK